MLYIRPLGATAGHESRIRKLQCLEEFVYSSSLDETIRVWHHDGSLASTLTPNHTRVRDFAVDQSHTVYSLTEDGALQIFLPGKPPTDNELIVKSYKDFVRDSFNESFQMRGGGTSPYTVLPTRSISCPRGTAISCTAAALIICHSDCRVSVTTKNDESMGASVMTLATPSPLLCLDRVSANCAVLGGADGNTYWLDIRKTSLRPLVIPDDQLESAPDQRGYTHAIRSLGEYTGVTISQDNVLRFWDWRKPEEAWHSYTHSSRVSALNASPEYLAFGDEGGQVWTLRQSEISEALINHSKDILRSTIQSPAHQWPSPGSPDEQLAPKLGYTHSRSMRAVGAVAVSSNSTLFSGHWNAAIVNAGRLEAGCKREEPRVFPYASPVKHSTMLPSQHHILSEKFPDQETAPESAAWTPVKDKITASTDTDRIILQHLYTKKTDKKSRGSESASFDQCAGELGASMVAIPKYYDSASNLKGHLEIGIPLSDSRELLSAVTLGTQWFDRGCIDASTPKIINIGYAVVYSIYCHLQTRPPEEVVEPWLGSVLATFDWQNTHISITSKRGFVAGSIADIAVMTSAEKFLRHAITDDDLVTALINTPKSLCDPRSVNVSVHLLSGDRGAAALPLTDNVLSISRFTTINSVEAFLKTHLGCATLCLRIRPFNIPAHHKVAIADFAPMPPGHTRIGELISRLPPKGMLIIAFFTRQPK